MATIDTGKQEISIHYLQDVRSISANKLIEEITPIGVLQSEVSIEGFTGSSIQLSIKKGTTIVFGGYFVEGAEVKTFPVKIRINEDFSKLFDLASYSSENAVSIFGQWAYTLNINNRFISWNVQAININDALYQTNAEDSKIRICNIRKKDNSLPWGITNAEISYDGLTSYNYFNDKKQKALNYETILTFDKKGFVCLGFKDFIKTSFINLPFVPFSSYSIKTIPGLNSTELAMKNKRWTELPLAISGLADTNTQVDILYLVNSFIGDTYNTEQLLKWSSKNIGTNSINKDNIHSFLSGISFDDITNEGIMLLVCWRTKSGGILPDTIPSDSIFFSNNDIRSSVTPIYPNQLNVPIYIE